MKYIFTLFFAILLTSCAIEEQKFDFNKDEITRLLLGDSLKQWIRVSRINSGSDESLDECGLKQILIFSSQDDDNKGFEFEFRTSPLFCNGIDSIVNFGTCIIIIARASSGDADSIAFITSLDTINHGLIKLTSEVMKTAWKVNGNLIEEEYQSAGN